PQAKKDPNTPKPARANWTNSKICFLLNKFLTKEEDGNMIGGNWKPVAYSNVHNRYTLAYPEDKLTREQIKNLYTTSKSAYTGMKKVKMNSEIGWVGGKIDMPDKWWENTGKKDKDALKLWNHSSNYYDKMDVMLHGSRPAGALRTGTSSNAQVEVENHKEQEIEIIDPETLKENQDEELSTPNPLTTSTVKKESIKPFPEKPAPVLNIKKKTPAHKVKPMTLATVIVLVSNDTTIKAQEKADCSAQLNSAITKAARIKANKLPNLQKSLELFNPNSENKFPNLDDQSILIDVRSEEAKATVFGGLDPKMRWVWLKAQVNSIKDHLEERCNITQK
ncbi:hypothetical protein DFH28DRAFT_1201067, partial [Melampsora americana]